MPNDARRVISRRLLFKNKEQNLEEETMEYLIVTGVVLMMAFYAVIVARCLNDV